MSANNTTSTDPTTSPPPTTLPPTTSDPTTSVPPNTTPTTPPTTSLPPTTSEPPTSSPPTTSAPPTTSTPPTTQPTTSQQPPTTITKTSIITPTSPGGVTSTVIITSTSSGGAPDNAGSQTLPPTSSTSAPGALDPSNPPSEKLSQSGRIAIAVVVPIAAVALLICAGIWFWRRRKQRKDLEEQRRKEVEDYAYNPNADPSIPAVAGATGASGAYEMKEDGTSGYRGWGSTTLASSTGRKASTTMSGGAAGVAYSDATSPTRGNVSDTRSGEPLMTMTDGSHSPEGEILGAMGPSSAANRSADVHRGPSNASSSYSAAARSDGSGEGGIGVAYGSGGPGFYDQYPANGNPYTDGAAAFPNRPGPAEAGAGQPVIRDVTARRNTRIENPAHYPQQSAGISQNF